MSGFRKARAEQAALKLGIYGPPGSGKTFTSLLLAEGLANLNKRRVAMVDTEHGSDFYCQPVPSRRVHPDAFDFDAIYTRSLTETIAAIRGIGPTHSVIVIDSITHLWDAARAAYSGKTTRAGTIPMHAWGSIKRPYKELMNLLLNSPAHVLICGRQGTEYADTDDGEIRAVGFKMKSEGETPYEPHILIRMEAVKPVRPTDLATIRAFVEKDRTGVLAGRLIENPTFDSICGPLLGLLSGNQAQLPTEDEVAVTDSEALSDMERTKEAESTEILNEFLARIQLCKSHADLKSLGAEITPAMKAKMRTTDVTTLREAYQDRERALATGVTKRRLIDDGPEVGAYEKAGM